MNDEVKFNSQICTSVEQSKRLLELGLKPETADMKHFFDNRNDYSFFHHWECIPYEWDKEFLVDSENIPAWSLHRLKCLLPTKIPYESGYLTTEIINNVNLMFLTDTSEQRLISFIHENLYESMIKCIKWLIKEDYFNKEYLKQ